MLNVQFLIDHLKQHLSPELYPSQLEARYPHVLTRIMQSWVQGELAACFNDLLIQDDQLRDGFPPDVATELFRLQIALDGLNPKQNDPWGHIRREKVADADLQTLSQHGHQATPQDLKRAIEQRQYELLPAFIRAGLAIEQQDNAGWTPIMHACFAGKLDVVIQLIKLGANLNVKDQHGYSLLHWAALNGNANLLALLIKHKLNPRQASHKGITPLMQAAAGGHLAAMRCIVAHAGVVAIHACSDEGWTALHKATANKHVSAALWLAERSANPYQQNQQGESACSLALKQQQTRMYELLNECAERQSHTFEWQLA